MAKVNKKDSWNNYQWYKHYRNQGWLAKSGKYVCTAAPVITLFAVKWNEYFKIIDGTTPYKFTIGAIICVIVAVIAVMQDIKETESEQVKLVLSLAKWWAAFIIVACFSAVFKDLQSILMYEAIGQSGSYACAMIENNRKEWALSYKNGVPLQKAMKKSEDKKGIPTE